MPSSMKLKFIGVNSPGYTGSDPLMLIGLLQYNWGENLPHFSPTLSGRDLADHMFKHKGPNPAMTCTELLPLDSKGYCTCCIWFLKGLFSPGLM